MTNDLCYMNGEDISIEYKETKPIRNYAFLIDSPYTGKGCDLEKYRDNGFINLSKIANANLSIIKEPNFETEELTENDTEETLETEQTES